jgi:hypothetical protein
MKKVKPFPKGRVPKVRINPELEKYRGKVLFPESLARANERLKNIKLPPREDSK